MDPRVRNFWLALLLLPVASLLLGAVNIPYPPTAGTPIGAASMSANLNALASGVNNLETAGAASLSAHTGRTDNPHSTTYSQVGADAAGSAAAAQSAVQGNLNTHTARTDNPHSVTATQTGAVAKAGDTMTGNLKISPVSESWAEGVSFLMPTGGRWGGLRWNRQRANNDGNWAVGYTGEDSTDDLTFYNNAGGSAYYRLRLHYAGGATIPGDGYIDFGPNSSWASILRVGGNGWSDGSRASVVTTNGNMHLDPAASRGLYLNWYAGTGVSFGDGASTQVGNLDTYGNLTLGIQAHTGSGYAPARITFDRAHSASPNEDTLKLYFYNNGPGQRYGIGLGAIGDVYFWSGAGVGGTRFFAGGNEQGRFLDGYFTSYVRGRFQVEGRGTGYTESSIELLTNDNTPPGISFHRGGYSACSLYEYDGYLYLSRWTGSGGGKVMLSSNLPYDLSGFVPGTLPDSAVVFLHKAARTFVIPQNLSGSYGLLLTATTGAKDFDLQVNGVSKGTISFAAGATTSTFTFANAVTVAAGDVIKIVAPATADATLAGFSFTLKCALNE